MDWLSALNFATEQFHISPALVSINISDTNSYNDCKIRISSNYWSDVPYIRICYQYLDSYSTPKVVDLNSQAIIDKDLGEDRKKEYSTHELCHAFGLLDCTDTSLIMYGSTWGSTNTITPFENNLFITRYGR